MLLDDDFITTAGFFKFFRGGTKKRASFERGAFVSIFVRGFAFGYFSSFI